MKESIAYSRLNKSASMLGIDQPDATVIQENGRYLYLKVPGHRYWSAHAETDYMPVSHEVWEFDADVDMHADDPNGRIRGQATLRISW